MFHADVDSDMTVAIVSQNIGPRDRRKQVDYSAELDGPENEMSSKGTTRNTHVTQKDGRDAELLQNTDTDTLRELSSVSIQHGSDEHSGELVHISAILYLGPPEMPNNWEFKSIVVENQSTHAILFNLRRLFPFSAEKILRNRTELGNAIAIQSSQMSAAILRHMLRLSFYIEGDETANLTLERLEGNDQKTMEKSDRDRDVQVPTEMKLRDSQ